MENCHKKEKEKLWEFSVDKTLWMCINNRKRNLEDIRVEINQGMLRRTEKYKYLGNFVNEKGNMDAQLEYMETKIPCVIREGNKLCCPQKVGKAEIDAKILVHKAQIVPAVFYNLEAWMNIRKADWERIERIQLKILRGLFGLTKNTILGNAV